MPYQQTPATIMLETSYFWGYLILSCNGRNRNGLIESVSEVFNLCLVLQISEERTFTVVLTRTQRHCGMVARCTHHILLFVIFSTSLLLNIEHLVCKYCIIALHWTNKLVSLCASDSTEDCRVIHLRVEVDILCSVYLHTSNALHLS